MLKLAMLGAWHVHAPDYADQIKAHPEAEIALVWDDNESRGKAFAEKLDVPFQANLKQVLEDPTIHGVIINTPTSMHPTVITEAAKAGKHVFTEKVLTTTLSEALEVAEAIRKAGIKFTISFPHRSKPHNLFAKEAVEKGWLGKITLLRIRNAHNGAGAGWLPEHFYDRNECGGGAMIDLGAHGMYLTRWLLGMPESVNAALTFVTGKEVEDNAVTFMKYEDGCIAIQETGFVSSQSPFSLEIYGTEGSLLIQGPNQTITFATNSSGEGGISGWIVPSRLPQPGVSPMEQWIEGIRNDAPIDFGVEDGIALTQLMVAAYQAHETGTWVKLADL